MGMKIPITINLALMLISGFAQNLTGEDQHKGLVFYYDYSEVSEGKVSDKSGNGYDGAVHGNIKIVMDPVHGQVAKFAQGSYLELDHAKIKADGNIPTKAFSVLAWVNVKNNGAHHEIFNARGLELKTWLVHSEVRVDDVYRWILRAAGPAPGKTIFEIRGGKPKTGKWVHYAGTYDRHRKPSAILYIDGVVVGTASGNLRVCRDWGLGARVGINVNDSRPFVGMMDEISVWERGFNRQEVQKIIEKGLDGFLVVSPLGKLAIVWAKLKSKK